MPSPAFADGALALSVALGGGVDGVVAADGGVSASAVGDLAAAPPWARCVLAFPEGAGVGARWGSYETRLSEIF